MTEQELLNSYVTARKEVKRLDDLLKEAKDVLEKAETLLIGYMDDNSITSTAKYDELGRVSKIAPMLRVSIEPGKEPEAMDFLRSIGEGNAIRETIHWKTLSSIMKGKIEKNEPLPDSFKYYFQEQVRYEEPK